jgi:hypothetical protein
MVCCCLGGPMINKKKFWIFSFLIFLSCCCFPRFVCGDTADNIGFVDHHGLTNNAITTTTTTTTTPPPILKVFDFDVARILPPDSVPSSSATVFHLTRHVGSPRYMSPECARGEQYNYQADVYTMGLLCYELLTLQKPYHDIPDHNHAECVFYNKARPKLPPVLLSPTKLIASILASDNPSSLSSSLFKSKKKLQQQQQQSSQQPHGQFWSVSLQDLVQRMWNEDITQRPTMMESRIELQSHAAEIQNQINDIQSQLDQQQLHHHQQQQQQHQMLEGTNMQSVQLQQQSPDSSPNNTTTSTSINSNSNNIKRPFPLRLWKSNSIIDNNNDDDNNKILNRSRHYRDRYFIRNRSNSHGSLLGTTLQTSNNTTTTGLSCNFASFHNLVALNEQQNQ